MIIALPDHCSQIDLDRLIFQEELQLGVLSPTLCVHIRMQLPVLPASAEKCALHLAFCGGFGQFYQACFTQETEEDTCKTIALHIFEMLYLL